MSNNKVAYLPGFSDSKSWHDVIKYVIPNCEVSRYLVSEGWELVVDGPNICKFLQFLGMKVSTDTSKTADLILITHPHSLGSAIDQASMYDKSVPVICVDGDCHIRNYKKHEADLVVLDLIITRAYHYPDHLENISTLLFSNIDSPYTDVPIREGLSFIGHLKSADQKSKYAHRKSLYEYANENISDSRYYGEIDLPLHGISKDVNIRTARFRTSVLDMRPVYIKHGYITPKVQELINSSNIVLLPKGHPVLDQMDYPKELYYDPYDLRTLVKAYESSKSYTNTTNILKNQIDWYLSHNSISSILSGKFPDLFT